MAILYKISTLGPIYTRYSSIPNRFRKYAVALFPGKDEQVKASFDQLAKLLDEEQRLVLAVSYATNQKIDKKADKIVFNTEGTREASDRMDKELEGVTLSLQGRIIKSCIYLKISSVTESYVCL
jgi:hypothetical protein